MNTPADLAKVPESIEVVVEPAAILPVVPGYLRMSMAVGVMALIALVAALYFARAFFVPLLIGILASYALHPLVDWLKAWHVPRPAGAAVVLAVLLGSLSWIGFSLSSDATAMFR